MKNTSLTRAGACQGLLLTLVLLWTAGWSATGWALPPGLSQPLPSYYRVNTAPDDSLILTNYYTNWVSFEVKTFDAGVVSFATNDYTMTLSYGGNGSTQVEVRAINADGTTTNLITVVVDDSVGAIAIGNVTADEDDANTTIALGNKFTGEDGYALVLNGRTDLMTATVSGSNLILDYLTNANGGPFNVSVRATNLVASATNTFTVTITAVPDAPGVTGITNTMVTINDTNFFQPFMAVSITNYDDPLGELDIIVRLDNSLKGTFTGSSVGPGKFGEYGDPPNMYFSMSNAVPTNVVPLLQALRFEATQNRLPVGTTEDARIFLTAINGASPTYRTINSNAQVRVNSINDPPTLTGIENTAKTVFTGQASTPFDGATITDGDVSDTNGTGQMLTMELTQSNPSSGTFEYDPGSGFVLSGGKLTLANQTASSLTEQLRVLRFRAQSSPVEIPLSNNIVIKVTDSMGASVTTTNSVIQVATPYVTPDISGTAGDQEVGDKSAKLIFIPVLIQGSATGVRLKVRREIDLAEVGDSFGELLNFSSNGFVQVGASNNAYYLFTNTTMEIATAHLRDVAYRPRQNILSNDMRLVFEIALLNNAGTEVGKDTRTVLTIKPENDLPVILGAASSLPIFDFQTIQPFLTQTNPIRLVQILDYDENSNQTVNVSIQLDNPLKGDLTNAMALGFNYLSGAYVLTNVSPEVASSNLQALVFVPAANRLSPGSGETVRFTLTVDDRQGESVVVNSATTVTISSLNDAPVIDIGPTNLVVVNSGATILPFSAASVTDSDAGAQTLTVTVTLDDMSKGSLGSLGGFTNTPLYTFTGTDVDATASLRGLVFQPAAGFGGQNNRTVFFAITARDSLGAYSSNGFTMLLNATNRTRVVTTTANSGPGSLRQAVLDANNNDHIVFNLSNTVSVIRLDSEIVLDKTLYLLGPGANRLTVSGDFNSDGVADARIFRITNGLATITGLGFADSTHEYAGGAIGVDPSSSLNISDCAFMRCMAGQWGGAIDINRATLVLHNCLFVSNSVTSALGQGGGAVSLFTDRSCHIENCTFVGNDQANARAYGGGAVYAENSTPGLSLPLEITHCTFKDNHDKAEFASSLYVNGFGCTATVVNTIFADGNGYNLIVAGGGVIHTEGGNLSDDSTSIDLSQGGDPLDVVLLDHATDRTNAVTGLLPLQNNGGTTDTSALATNSVAINQGRANQSATDQRGVWRDTTPDSGAFESSHFQRLVINEIMFNPAGGMPSQYIEFYNPRDSATLDVNGYTVWVDGVLRHTFTAMSLEVSDGLLLKASAGVVAPGGVKFQIASTGGLSLSPSGSTIQVFDPAGNLVLTVSFNGLYDNNASLLSNESINLSPEFNGWTYVPYSQVIDRTDGQLSSPGASSGGQILAKVNAPPVANTDSAATDEDTPIYVDVLANDIELDREDYLIVSNVVATSTLQAQVSIPAGATNVLYDPSNSPVLRSLPVGAVTNDTFIYNIMDRCCDRLTGTNQVVNGFRYFATNTVVVTGVNDNPTPANDTGITAPANSVLVINLQTSLLANDSDPDTDDSNTTLLPYAVSAHSTNITQTLEAVSAMGALVTLKMRFDRNETTVEYDPRAVPAFIALPQGQTTNDTFHYTLIDRHDALGTAKVTITVVGTNNGPVAVTDTLVGVEDQVLTTPWSVLVTNDLDVDTVHTLTVVAVTTPSASGAVVTMVGPNIIYNPTNSAILNAISLKETLTDVFSYTVMDDWGALSTTNVNVIVHGRNDLPTAGHDYYTTDEDTTLVVAAVSGVLANDTDPDVNSHSPDDTLHVSPFENRQTALGALVTMATNGAFSFNPNGRFNYLSPGQTALESFQYTLVDNTFTVANDDDLHVLGGSADVTLPVLANDVLQAYTGGTMTIIGVGTPDKGGLVRIDPTGQTLVYSPAGNFSGLETITYTIADGQGAMDTATARITVVVSPLNSALRAGNDAYIVSVGNTVSLDVLANDNLLPAGSSTLTITSVSAPNQGGAAVISGPGLNNRVVYTPVPAPAATYPYYETFAYTFSGNSSSAANGSVTVMVINRTNTLPVNNDAFVIEAGTSGNTLEVLLNDKILPEALPGLSIVAIQTNNLRGTVSIKAGSKALVYNADAVLTDYLETNFSYTVSDGVGGTATGTVAIEVKADGLYASVDDFRIEKNSATVRLDVVPNDILLPYTGVRPIITLIGIGTNAPNQGGTVSITADQGALLYTPASNFVGLETFTYEVSDGSLLRARAQVRATVLDVSTLPTSADVFAVARDSLSNRLDVVKNDYIFPQVPGVLDLASLLTNGVRGNVAITGVAPAVFLAYTPASNFIGQEIFSYVVVDPIGNRGTNQVTVNVGGLTARPDVFSVVSDSTNNLLQVTANDRLLPDYGFRKIVALSAPNRGGTVVTNADATAVIYKPLTNVVGNETFTYTVADDTGATYTENVTVQIMAIRSDRVVGTVTVTVTGINHNPAVRPDQMAGDEDAPLAIPHATLLANDTDADSGLVIQSVTGTSAQGVTVQIVGTNVIYYPQTSPVLQALARNEVLVDTFSYTAADDQGATGTAVVTVTVTGQNDAPIPGTNNYTTDANTTLNVAGPGLLATARDLDVNGTPPDDVMRLLGTVTNTTTTGATVVVRPDGGFSYNPNGKFLSLALGSSTNDVFPYTIVDSSQIIAKNDTFTLTRNSVSNLLAITANDVVLRATGGSISISSVGIPSQGGIALMDASQMAVYYTPQTGFTGTETFTYSVIDGQGVMDMATVTVQVAAAPASPGLNVDYFTVLSDSVSNVLDVLMNDVLVPGTVGIKPIAGMGPGNQGGEVYTNVARTLLYYTPVPGFAGVETIPYRVVSATNSFHTNYAYVQVVRRNGDRTNATATVAVQGVNDAPVPVDDWLAASEKTLLDINVQTSLLPNDADPDTDDNPNTLLIYAVHPTSNIVQSLVATSALGATVTLEIRFDRNQSRILYDSTTSSILKALSVGETTVDSFYYSIIDSHGARGAARIFLTVTGVNDPPVAYADSVVAYENTPLVIPRTLILANDRDPDTDDNGTSVSTLQITNITLTSVQGAVVSFQTNGDVLYNAVSPAIEALARKETLADAFTYVITDKAGGWSTNVVNITVRGRNDTPQAVSDNYTNNEYSVMTVVPAGVITNDIEVDINGSVPDDVLTVIPFTNVLTRAGALVTMNADGGFIYDPNGRFNTLRSGQTTNDTFSYTVKDNSLTIAEDDDYTVLGGSSGNVFEVALNDILLANNGATLVLVSATAPDQGGSASINLPQNTITYAPAAGFHGVETFRYTLTDGQGNFDTATVQVRVTAVNGLTRTSDDSYTVALGNTVTLPVLGNDEILPANGSGLTITQVGMASRLGLVTINGAGAGNTLHYTPNPGTNVLPYLETFAYSVVGLGGETATGSVQIKVVDRANTLPANKDTWAVDGGVTTALAVLTNDIWLMDSNVGYTIVSIQTNSVMGNVAIDPTGRLLLYTPKAGSGDYDDADFQYTVQDGFGGTATASVSVQVWSNGLVAAPDAFTTMKDRPQLVLPVLANDILLPAGGSGPTISAIGLGTNAPNQGGTVTISADLKTLLYTPAPNFAGIESFTYETSDGGLGRAEARVTVQVLDMGTVNTCADIFRVGRDSANNSLNVLANDSVLPALATLRVVSINTTGLRGSATLSGATENNTVLYSAEPGFIGREVFSYVAIDGRGNLGTNSITVWVGGLIENEDDYSVLSDTVANVLPVLANDRLFGTTVASSIIAGVSAPDMGGAAVTNATGTAILYTPAASFVGTETFQYWVADASGVTYTQEVTMTVLAPGSDRSNAVVTVTVVRTRASAYEAWQRARFGDAILGSSALESTVWGDYADPDLDGIYNLLEYIVGSDPMDIASTGVLPVEVQPSSDGKHIEVSFLRHIGDDKVVYTLWYSTNLVTWQVGQSMVVTETAVAVDAEFEWVTWKVAHNLPGGVLFRLEAR